MRCNWIALFILIPLLFPLLPLGASPVPASVAGVWEGSDRFVEFDTAGRMRIILKPYYGFVYEDTGWIPVEAETGINDTPVVTLSVRYSGEKKDQFVPLARIGDGLYFRFFTKMPFTVKEAPVVSSASEGAVSVNPGLITREGVELQTSTAGSSNAGAGTQSIPTALNGFWLSSGNADSLKLYRTESVPELFCFYFDGDTYCRIRYWAAEVRVKDIPATFTGTRGETVSIPKFMDIGGVLYTCITSTGSVLRNYEKGRIMLSGNALQFLPDRVVYEGTDGDYRFPVPYRLSHDGLILALGSPYLTVSKIADLDAEITAHNGKRRPPRKPIFGFMELDFRWDEIERIRNKR